MAYLNNSFFSWLNATDNSKLNHVNKLIEIDLQLKDKKGLLVDYELAAEIDFDKCEEATKVYYDQLVDRGNAILYSTN